MIYYRTVLAIDPGTYESSCVLLDIGTGDIIDRQDLENTKMLEYLYRQSSINVGAIIAIEKVASYGMAVGEEVFETVYWSGRFDEAVQGLARRIPRSDIKMSLCKATKAKDSNIRQALIDRYGGTSAIKKGGRLYGVHKHQWSALALAVCVQDKEKEVKIAIDCKNNSLTNSIFLAIIKE